MLAADRPADDATLIARSRADPEAFAAIFDRHATGIHRYAARRLGPGPAEDVVGETFLVAFRRRDRYDLSRPDAGPWLFGIATNMISRHRQAEVRLYRALARLGIDDAVESFLAALPTDPGRLRTWIYRHPGGGNTADAQAWSDIGDMLREMLVPPKLAAALYRVAATIPGATVVPHAANAVGRVGVTPPRADKSGGGVTC